MKSNKKLWNVLKEAVRDSRANPNDVFELIFDNGNYPMYDIGSMVAGSFSREEIGAAYKYLPPATNEGSEVSSEEFSHNEVANLKYVLKSALIDMYDYFDQFDKAYGSVKGIDIYGLPDFAVLNYLISNRPIY